MDAHANSKRDADDYSQFNLYANADGNINFDIDTDLDGNVNHNADTKTHDSTFGRYDQARWYAGRDCISS